MNARPGTLSNFRKSLVLSGARSLWSCLVVIGASWAVFEQGHAAEQPVYDEDLSAELPRIPPVSPENAVETFVVAPGFRIEQVAAEPLVTDPIALAFDAAGRMFVVEMHDYSEDAEGRLGVVRLLTDVDGDGRFDNSTVFVDGLSWPTAVLCYDGGIFVGAAPDIWYFKDTDGDGRADVSKKVFTGFGRGNVQGLLNSFAWGLDNRIHGATSSAGGVVRRADDENAKTITLGGRDFAFDPRTLKLEATSGGGQYGMSFDKWGRKFVCSNSDHIQQVMFEDRYVARNPYLAAPSPRVSIAADGPAAEIYRASPVEPWRVVRTRLRVAGKVPGPIEGGGRASGYFTGATGITIYRGNAWGSEWDGLAVMGDACTNLAHRKRLEPNGLEMIARRIDRDSEFVASKDIWFRPVQFANAPDGTLYVADMYREVIEHPLSLPPAIKKHLDLTSGRDRGRIYRVVPEGFVQPRLANLDKATTAELVETLAHPNGWHRETAARLLYERQDRMAVPALDKLATQSPEPEGRMHALYALAGLASVPPATLVKALSDEHPRVRQHAVRLAEREVRDASVQAALVARAKSEEDLEVRYQLLFTLGYLDAPQRDAALAHLARELGDDRWLRLALLSSLGDGVAGVFTSLVGDEAFLASAGAQPLLSALATQAGVAGRREDITAVISAVERLHGANPDIAAAMVRGLSEGMSRQGRSLGAFVDGGAAKQTHEILAGLLADARRTTLDEKRGAADRARAVGMLMLGPASDATPILKQLIGHRQPQEVQLAALAALGRSSDPDAAQIIIEAWPTLSPRLRSQAGESLLARADRIPMLLDAIAAAQFKPLDLEPARVQQLLNHADPKLRARAQELLGGTKLGRRQEVVAAYRSVLDRKGDRVAGKAIFQKVCAACHRVEGVGHEIGANLAAMKNRGPEAILVNVLDPNREVNPQFVNYLATTTDGRMLTGMIEGETATSITLKRAEGATDTVLRVDVEELSASGQSLMPEGIEQQLGTSDEDRIQALANLIAYLMSTP